MTCDGLLVVGWCISGYMAYEMRLCIFVGSQFKHSIITMIKIKVDTDVFLVSQCPILLNAISQSVRLN